MSSRSQNIAGRRFNKLTALELVYIKSGHAHWRFRCECGETKIIKASRVKAGNSQSCGCSTSDLMAAAKFKHGHWKGSRASPEWSAWCLARNRCRNPEAPAYADYGGRGITMCARWADGEAGKTGFECFLKDMGPRPSSRHTLDRRENDQGYEPGNCRWATMKVQGRNRRNNRIIEFLGERLCVSEAAERFGMKTNVVCGRLDRGWSVERALTEPLHR